REGGWRGPGPVERSALVRRGATSTTWAARLHGRRLGRLPPVRPLPPYRPARLSNSVRAVFEIRSSSTTPFKAYQGSGRLVGSWRRSPPVSIRRLGPSAFPTTSGAP